MFNTRGHLQVIFGICLHGMRGVGVCVGHIWSPLNITISQSYQRLKAKCDTQAGRQVYTKQQTDKQCYIVCIFKIYQYIHWTFVSTISSLFLFLLS